MSVPSTEPQFHQSFPVADEPVQAPPKQDDYFGFSAEKKFYFPDGVTYIAFVTMNEGKKKKYQKATSSDLIIAKNGNESRLRVDQAEARHQLILQSVTSWNLTRGGAPLPFGERALRDFLELGNPKLVEDLENAIRRENPWLTDQIPSAEIRKGIEELEEQYTAAVERERGEASSSGR
jgi:hypothetical protein